MELEDFARFSFNNLAKFAKNFRNFPKFRIRCGRGRITWSEMWAENGDTEDLVDFFIFFIFFFDNDRCGKNWNKPLDGAYILSEKQM